MNPPDLINKADIKPLLVVISGPSGVGKDAVLNCLKQREYPLHFVMTITTRHKRATELDGKPYQFVGLEIFKGLNNNGELVEASNVYGNWYGVPKKEIEAALNQGLDAVVKVDIQGAFKIKTSFPDAILIFLSPPSFEDLIKRLRGRNTDSEKDIDLRISTAKEEMRAITWFKYVLINHHDEIERTATEIYSIIQKEKEFRKVK